MDTVDTLPGLMHDVVQKKKRKTFADSLEAPQGPANVHPQGGWQGGWGNTGGGPTPMQPPPPQGGWGAGWGNTGGGPTPQQPPPQGMMRTMQAPTPTLQPGQLPPPPTGNPLQGQLAGFASQGLTNPSRWNSQLMQDGAGVIEQSIARMRGQGMNALDERMSGRGLVGSSVEADNARTFEESLQQQGMDRLFNLQREAANTYAQDRNAAAGTALGSLGYGLDEREFDAGEQARKWMKDIEILRLLGMG